MTVIHLHAPVASTSIGDGSPDARFERVHMFAGRHLGEVEFDHQQLYADRRLLSVMAKTTPGVVHGLDVEWVEAGSLQEGIAVTSGLVIDGLGRCAGLYFALKVEITDLITRYLETTGATDALGVYYLVITREQSQVDGPSVMPCQRLDFDPTRDMRRLTLGRLEIKRLNVDPAALSNGGAPQELIENHVASAGVTVEHWMTQNEPSVPLALLALSSGDASSSRILWLSQAAGRYESVPHSGYRVLLNQTTQAFARRMHEYYANQNVQPSPALPLFLAGNLLLDYLPASGQLPLEWLQNAETAAPSVLWLPGHLWVDMVPVPQATALEHVYRNLPRGMIDLNDPSSGDKIRLLLALDEADYDPRLLDFPARDKALSDSMYLAHIQAYETWYNWRTVFDILYSFSSDPDIDRRTLGIPKDVPPPETPDQVFNRFSARVARELSDVDLPPSLLGPLGPPLKYSGWTAKSVPESTENGLVVQLALEELKKERVENQIQAERARLEKTRDYQLLLRQQLDMQTASLSSLAGGIAGDGTGMQVARWMPYIQMKDLGDAEVAVANGPAQPPPSQPAGDGSGAVTLGAGETETATRLMAIGPVSGPVETSFLRNIGAAIAKGAASAAYAKVAPQSQKVAVTNPTYEAAEYRFGVMDHVSPEVNEYAKAYHGMEDLRLMVSDSFEKTDADAIQKRFDKFERPTPPQDLDDRALRDSANNPKIHNQLLTQYRYKEMFKAGKVLVQWTALFENRYHEVERNLLNKLRELARLNKKIAELTAQIRAERNRLEQREAARIEALGDYGIAQRLVEEDWWRIYRRTLERTVILTTRVRGLYYVRVRETDVALGLPDPLPLRFAEAGDLVPGCDGDHDTDIPASLRPFLDSVYEIPMTNWERLDKHTSQLPAYAQLQHVEVTRISRLAVPHQVPVHVQQPNLAIRLAGPAASNQAAIAAWEAQKIQVSTTSARKEKEHSASVLSLIDLASLHHSIRKPATDLRNQLEQCARCLVEKLGSLPGSIRFQWGQLAEDDRLRVDDISYWPGLETAETFDFNTVRTIAELVQWWFRQLTQRATADAKTTMRNMVRAIVIYASLGNPDEIIQGTVSVPPKSRKPGELLRLKLDRVPKIGTKFHLLNPKQELIAIATVDDHDGTFTTAKLVEVAHTEVSITTKTVVISAKTTGVTKKV